MNSESTPLISIGITSYNRTKELRRCLDSIDITSDKIEIIISEDNSPQKEKIDEIISDYSKSTDNRVLFNSNGKNLGYDNNLAKIIELAHGKYVLFMSDDDSFNKGILTKCIDYLDSLDENIGMAYTYFNYSFINKEERKHNGTHICSKGLVNCQKYIYDAILFSGLIFRRDYVRNISAERFRNLNYFQVYLFLTCMYKYSTFYMDIPLVCYNGDGENVYGISESSKNDEKAVFLVNRKSIISNVYFNQGLIASIRIFDDDNKCNVLLVFEREYSIHSYSGLSIARRNGTDIMKEYWDAMHKLDIKIHWQAYMYYYLLNVFGENFIDTAFSGIKKVAKWVRRIR